MKANIESHERTPAMILGEAFHYRVLFPALFDGAYAFAPKCDKRTKEGKATWSEFCLANQGKAILSDADKDFIADATGAVWYHPKAAALLGGDSRREVSGVWQDSATGVLCKFRADLLCPSLRIVADIKTTEDASLDAFQRSIFGYGYHRQAAFYLDGLKALGKSYDHFLFIAVEKGSSQVAVYRLTEEAIALGRKEISPLLELYARCEEKQEWPGYPTDIRDIALPTWAMREAL